MTEATPVEKTQAPPLPGTYRLHGRMTRAKALAARSLPKSKPLVKGRSASRGRLTAAHQCNVVTVGTCQATAQCEAKGAASGGIVIPESSWRVAAHDRPQPRMATDRLRRSGRKARQPGRNVREVVLTQKAREYHQRSGWLGGEE